MPICPDKVHVHQCVKMEIGELVEFDETCSWREIRFFDKDGNKFTVDVFPLEHDFIIQVESMNKMPDHITDSPDEDEPQVWDVPEYKPYQPPEDSFEEQRQQKVDDLKSTVIDIARTPGEKW